LQKGTDEILKTFWNVKNGRAVTNSRTQGRTATLQLSGLRLQPYRLALPSGDRFCNYRIVSLRSDRTTTEFQIVAFISKCVSKQTQADIEKGEEKNLVKNGVIYTENIDRTRRNVCLLCLQNSYCQFGDGNAEQEKQMTDMNDMFPLIETERAHFPNFQ
jgi:hypothetical protein